MAEGPAHCLARLGNELVAQARQYAQLMRLDKPVGIWLLLWPTLWGLWIAGAGRDAVRRQWGLPGRYPHAASAGATVQGGREHLNLPVPTDPEFARDALAQSLLPFQAYQGKWYR
ncbi:MAG: hypothetical protein EXR82_07430 [Gammaproteobacteria bacterium]|nr:hypothetical protein [Gammaproteobacteria bacterium]